MEAQTCGSVWELLLVNQTGIITAITVHGHKKKKEKRYINKCVMCGYLLNSRNGKLYSRLNCNIHQYLYEMGTYRWYIKM